jgi:hypothetical protein
MGERPQLGDPGLEPFFGIPGTRKRGIVGNGGIRSIPVARSAPIFHIGWLELEIVTVGDTSFGGEAVGVTILLTEVHLSDVEIHELAFLGQ